MKHIWIFLFLWTTQAFAQISDLPCQEQTLKLMSLNAQIHTSKFQVGPWKLRSKEIADLIREHHVVGLQEVLTPMLQDLTALLPEFEAISVGREDGALAGEHATLFFQKSRLEVLKTATFWLSRTPDVPGSVGWDAWAPRIVTWAQFRDRLTGRSFYVFNTHFDHWGPTAQIESAKLLGSVSALLTEGDPSVVLGDFNVKPKGEVYQTFLEYSGLRDAMSAGPHQGPPWTYSFFGAMKSKIDYAFTSSQVKVCNHSILAEDPKAPTKRSDHLPVSVSLELKDPVLFED